MSYQLGIDTGGTYTDAVIIDAERQVVAKNKSLTTRHELAIGIAAALAHLPQELLSAVNLVALSTTLSTNSVVEGRGAPISILLPGYTERQVEKSGLRGIIDGDFIIPLAGGHSAVGAELAALDITTAAQKIRQHDSQVSAFAVSGLFATRNSSHECVLRDLIGELSGKPVACGHELATSLGAPRRALTAALNARMIPYIQTLIDAVEAMLRERGLTAPLMVVKGDGSLVNARTARRQPVATVLSGPAASVIGACALSRLRDAIVVDMGGTTTDIAMVADGQPELCEHGARIGDWQPMVEAIRVFSIGLGGDSEVRFDGRMSLSARRVVPLSLLAHQFPGILPMLERQLSAPPSPRNNRFALRLQSNEALLARLNAVELAAWEALKAAPIELESLVDKNRLRLRAIAKMERLGLVIYSGFTPSDATHVLGMSAHWSAPAARLAAKIWARQMRHLYGCGAWPADDEIAPCRQVFALVARKISEKIIQAGLNHHDKLPPAHARGLTQLLADMVLDGGQNQPRIGRQKGGSMGGSMGRQVGGGSGRQIHADGQNHAQIGEGIGEQIHAGGEKRAESDQTHVGLQNRGQTHQNHPESDNPTHAAGHPRRPINPLFRLQFAADYPLLAVGGPARDYFPEVARLLGVKLHLPPNAEIANAVGAALGAVVQVAQVTVTQPQFGVFYLFHGQQPLLFDSLAAAMKKAQQIATHAAAALAVSAGAADIQTRIQQADNHVKHDIDGELFVSATITAIATGRPASIAEVAEVDGH